MTLSAQTVLIVNSSNIVALVPAPVLKNLSFILTREFYRSLCITEISDDLYPNEYNHPVASPAKLHRLVARARQWLQKNNYPVIIQSFRGALVVARGSNVSSLAS
jgi:hypothetical protein